MNDMTATASRREERGGRAFGTRTRLAAYGGALAVSFGAAAGVGAIVGPVDTAPAPHGGMATHDTDPHRDGHATDPDGHPATLGRPHLPGLSLDADGYRLVPGVDVVMAGVATEIPFRIVDGDGRAVTEYDVTHERELHLVVAARRGSTFHHLHPEQDADGTWTAELPALPAGSYRMFADTRPSGADGITLGVDLEVEQVDQSATAAIAGSPAATSAEPVDGDDGMVRASMVVDGIAVTLTARPTVGETEISFDIARSGTPVVADPYLGASGHLVALRVGDLAFLHVHPLGEATAHDPSVRFAAQLPTPGPYRLFLDASIDGVVRTFAFVIDAPDPTPTDGPADQHTDRTDTHDQNGGH